MPILAKLKVPCLLALAFVAMAGMECPVQPGMGVSLGTDGLVTLRIVNLSGLPATATAEYIISDQEVRKTQRYLEINGPNSETTILPTQTAVLRVVARVAPDSMNPNSAMAIPGEILAEQEYKWQIDFQNGDTILFTIPAPFSPPPGNIIDCNSNGISDLLDLANGIADDCNSNGIPDECDIAAGDELDCNANQVPDSCDIAFENELDCNGNQIPDSCDIAPGAARSVSLRTMAQLLFPRDESFQLAMPPNDDASSSEIELGFEFTFFGYAYDSVFINNNGNLTFDESFGGFIPAAFPNAARKIIAPFWADVDTRPDHGNVWYKLESNVLIVVWEEVGYFDHRGEKRNTFEVAISDGTNTVMGEGVTIAFCYGEMQWTTGFASGSNSGFGGIPATVGVNAGDGSRSILVGLFDHPGIDYDGKDGSNDGVDFLEWKCFEFSTANTSSNSAPIPRNIPGNCTFRVNPTLGESLDVQLEFASPEEGQVTTVSVEDLAGAQQMGLQIQSIAGNTAHVQLEWSPTCAEVGLYGLALSATDDFMPPGSTDSHIWIEVACTSLDCNLNGIPDECEKDCNGNGRPDDCDLAECESDPGCQDCNENGELDECDILSEFSSDTNHDSVPDECEYDEVQSIQAIIRAKHLPPDFGGAQQSEVSQ